MTLPKYPEPLTDADQKRIYQNQSEIMKWLRSRGHACIEDNKEARSCTMKKRYEFAPSVGPTMDVYPCGYCGGWHKTTRRENR